MLKKILNVMICNLGLVLRLLTGNHIKWQIINLVSVSASLKTSNKGKISLGKTCAVRPNTELAANGGEITLGSNCFINRNSMIVSHEAISIGNNTTIGPSVYIYDHDHDGHGGFISKPITIQEGVWIGAGAIILKGVTIGRNSIIAAGSIVNRDVAPNVLYIQKKNSEQIMRRRSR